LRRVGLGSQQREKRDRERNEKGISVAWARSSLILPIQVLFSASDGALGTRIHHSPAFFVRLSLRSCRIYKAASQPANTHIENGKEKKKKKREKNMGGVWVVV
jgi:hypothetical protein